MGSSGRLVFSPKGGIELLEQKSSTFLQKMCQTLQAFRALCLSNAKQDSVSFLWRCLFGIRLPGMVKKEARLKVAKLEARVLGGLNEDGIEDCYSLKFHVSFGLI